MYVYLFSFVPLWFSLLTVTEFEKSYVHTHATKAGSGFSRHFTFINCITATFFEE